MAKSGAYERKRGDGTVTLKTSLGSPSGSVLRTSALARSLPRENLEAAASDFCASRSNPAVATRQSRTSQSAYTLLQCYWMAPALRLQLWRPGHTKTCIRLIRGLARDICAVAYEGAPHSPREETHTIEVVLAVLVSREPSCGDEKFTEPPENTNKRSGVTDAAAPAGWRP